MKRTITLFAVLLTLCSIEVSASQLFLTTQAYRAKAIISGQEYLSYDGEFRLSHLRPGHHFVTIFERRRNDNGHHRGNGSYHNNNGRGGNRMVIFKGKIFIPQGTKVFARVSQRGRLIIEDVVPVRNHRSNGRYQHSRHGNGYGYHHRSRNYGRGYDYRDNGKRDDQRDRDRRYDDRDYDKRYDRRGDRNNNHDKQSKFSVALDMMNESSFENKKKTIAKQYLERNDVTSRQVLRLIKAFSFESTRLEIAKFAYNKTTDPENYFIVNKGFEFSSSTTALDRYIKRN